MLKDSDTIMRYLDYKKFDDLLKTKQIYMNGLLNFHNDGGDLLEGEIPDANKMASNGQLLRLEWNGLYEEISDVPDKKVKAVNYLEHFICINCWTMSKRENKEMWRRYANNKNSIIVKTSVGRLKQSLSKAGRRIHIQKIKYVNHSSYINPNPNPLSYCFLKDKLKFEWEKELRLMAVCLDCCPPESKLISCKTLNEYYAIDFEKEKGIEYIRIDCEIKDLIEEVIVSANHDDGFKKMLMERLKELGIDAKVSDSYYDIDIFERR